MTAPVDTAPAPAADTTTTADDSAGQAPADTGAGSDSLAPTFRPPHRSERVAAAGRDADDTDSSTGDAGSTAGEAGKGQAPASGSDDWSMGELPKGAQDLIKDLRRENGARRTEVGEQKKATQKATKAAEEALSKATASDEKFASAVEAFTRAIGLTPEVEPETQVPPEQRIEQLTTAYKERTVELAVYKSAAEHGGDPNALLDSRGFLTKVHALDPGADDFDAKVAEHIAAAVAANPKLRAAAQEAIAAAPSGGQFSGGPAEDVGPEDMSVEELRRRRAELRGR